MGAIYPIEVASISIRVCGTSLKLRSGPQQYYATLM